MEIYVKKKKKRSGEKFLTSCLRLSCMVIRGAGEGGEENWREGESLLLSCMVIEGAGGEELRREGESL